MFCSCKVCVLQPIMENAENEPPCIRKARLLVISHLKFIPLLCFITLLGCVGGERSKEILTERIHTYSTEELTYFFFVYNNSSTYQDIKFWDSAWQTVVEELDRRGTVPKQRLFWLAEVAQVSNRLSNGAKPRSVVEFSREYPSPTREYRGSMFCKNMWGSVTFPAIIFDYNLVWPMRQTVVPSGQSPKQIQERIQVAFLLYDDGRTRYAGYTSQSVSWSTYADIEFYETSCRLK